MAQRNKRDNKSRNYSHVGSDNIENGKKMRSKKGKMVEENIPESSLNSADITILSKRKGSNDISWYSNNPQMLKDVASLPFGNPMGVPFNRVKEGSTYVTPISSRLNAAVPGIMKLRFTPTLGNPQKAQDALNLAAQQVYSVDRAANSGASNYDKTDVMLMIAAMDSAYMLYASLVRVYKLLRKTDYTNRYRPDALVKCLDFNPSNLRKNMADFRYVINNFAYQLASINVPDQFDFINRHSWMCSNVYKDANEIKSQFYVFVPDGFYVYTEGSDSNPTSLEYKKITAISGGGNVNTGFTLDNIQTMIETIMNPILGSADLGNISGDLAKAFGEGGMIKIPTITEFEELDPIFNEEVLIQIQNADINGYVTPAAVVQNLTNLTYGPYLQEQYAFSPQTGNSAKALLAKQDLYHVMSVPSDNPTPELSMIASRLMHLVKYTVNNAGAIVNASVKSVGSEIIVNAAVYFINDAGEVTLGSSTLSGVISMDGTAISSNNLQLIEDFSKFDYAPELILLQFVDDPGAPASMQYNGDIFEYRNFTLVSDESVKDINDVAISSLFKAKSMSNKF